MMINVRRRSSSLVGKLHLEMNINKMKYRNGKRSKNNWKSFSLSAWRESQVEMLLTCEFGNAFECYIIDYHGLGAAFSVDGEQYQSVGAARLEIVQHE